MGPLVPQKGHGLHAVGSHLQMDGPVGFAEGFLRQPDITRTVFDQQNFDWHIIAFDAFHDLFFFPATVRMRFFMLYSRSSLC